MGGVSITISFSLHSILVTDWMLLIQVEWNGQKCVRQCKLTLVILFIFVLFKDKYYRINFQRDSNSDRQSRRRVRCTLDHHHGPSSVGIFNSTISNVPPWAHPFLQLRDDCMITFKRQNKSLRYVSIKSHNWQQWMWHSGQTGSFSHW